MAEIREPISHKEICELGIPHSSLNCGRVRKKTHPPTTISYPQTWNAERDKKFNPSLKMYSKQLKLAFVLRIDIFWD
jgi:hypothetical protein